MTASAQPRQAELQRPPRFFAGYALDLDGTVYLGDALLPGAAELARSPVHPDYVVEGIGQLLPDDLESSPTQRSTR